MSGVQARIFVIVLVCGSAFPLGRAQGCPCDGDVDGNGSIQLPDIVIVLDCVLGVEPPPEAGCDNADMNCDGTIDLCDASRVWCHFVGGTDCCAAGTVCGACCNSSSFPACAEVSDGFCDVVLAGQYRGDGTTCHFPCICGGCQLHADCAAPFCLIDLDDLLYVLGAFADADPATHFPGSDVVPCGSTSGTVDLDDILSAIAAFGGEYDCAHPCAPEEE